MKRRVGLLRWLGLLSAASCGDEASNLETAAHDSAVADSKDAGAPCAPLNSSRSCGCDSLRGATYCDETGWTDCECALPDGGTVRGGGNLAAADGGSGISGNLRSDIHFEWSSTPATEGSCEPGYYEGTFWGIYNSVIALSPIPVTSVDTPGRPGLAFTLVSRPNSGEKLFIENGIILGTADGIYPWGGTLTGSVDCDTLEVEFTLDGHYSIGLDGLGHFKFIGPVTATYDKSTRSMLNGTWLLDEYYPLDINPLNGGFGGWTAFWLRP